MAKIEKAKKGNVLLTMAAFVVVVAGIHAASSLVVRLLLALFIAFICGPLFFFLNRRGLPKAVALVIVLMMIIGFGLLLGVFIGTQVYDFTDDWPQYEEQITKIVSSTLSYLDAQGVIVPKETVMDILNPGAIMKSIGTMLTTLTGMLSDIVLILITVIFILLETSDLPAKVTHVWGQDSTVMRDLNKFAEIMQRYIALKTVISLATGFFVAVGLLIVGVKFALLWGLLAFLLNYIPTIGSIIAAIPPIILSLAQLGWGYAIIVFFIFLVINMIIGNFIEPRTMGQGLGLSTLIVFVSMVFWGWVLGPVGMLLSVPLTMSVKLYLESRDSTKWMAIILGQPIHKDKVAKNKSD